MIEEAERTGKLKPGGTIIDASSGNHGISVAMIGALKGYPVTITVSEKISQEKLQTIKAYGANVIMCPSTSFIEDPRSYHSQAVALHKKTPNSFMPDQYFNVDNARAHAELLGPEIWQQTDGKITHFFAGAGTGGTISGVGSYLKKQNPAIKVLAIDAATSFNATKGNPTPYKIEGYGIDWDSPVLDRSIIDEILPVSDENAIAMLKTLARKGFLVGGTSGGIAHAACEYAKKNLTENDHAVIIFGDSGRAYLTRNFY
jgi:cystathionine beta-synthase